MYEHDENEVLRDALSKVNEEVPPMPEGLHAAWMEKVEDSHMEKTTNRRSITRFLSVAAALVFVVGGTLLTRDDLSVKPDSMAYQSGYVSNASMKMAVNDAAADVYCAEEYATDASAGVMLTSTAMTRGAAADTEATPAAAEKKIIRTASMTITTQTYEDSLTALKSSCESLGGWIESSSENTNSYSGLRTAYLTLRVPQSGLDSYLAGTEELGRVTSRSETAQDVTASYQDTRARLDTQLALMERLQALITESGDLSDLLALESQIADTQYQIDRLQSSLNTTDRQVTYSTVDIQLREEKTAQLTDTTVTFGERIRSAIQVGCETLVGFLGDMVIFLVAALPFIAIVAAAAVIIRIVRKKRK